RSQCHAPLSRAGSLERGRAFGGLLDCLFRVRRSGIGGSTDLTEPSRNELDLARGGTAKVMIPEKIWKLRSQPHPLRLYSPFGTFLVDGCHSRIAVQRFLCRAILLGSF